MRTCIQVIAGVMAFACLWSADAVAADYARLKSCESEVRAFERQFKTQFGRLTVSEQELAREVEKHFVVDENAYDKYHYAWGQLQDADNMHSVDQARKAVAFFEEDARKEEASWGGRPPCKGLMGCYGDDNPEYALTAMRKSQMMACVARIRLEELSRSNASVSAPAPVRSKSPACTQEQVGQLNASLAAIDDAVGLFMQGPDGLSGAVTPALKVIMWATGEQSAAIRRSPCAAEPAFASRAAANDRSHQQAQANCLALNQQQVCSPADPRRLATGPAAGSAVGATAAKPAVKVGATDDCKGSGSVSGFLACQKSECRKAGFAPVEANGCITCGDEEGSYAGLQWRKCHPNSSGVSVGR